MTNKEPKIISIELLIHYDIGDASFVLRDSTFDGDPPEIKIAVDTEIVKSEVKVTVDNLTELSDAVHHFNIHFAKVKKWYSFC